MKNLPFSKNHILPPPLVGPGAFQPTTIQLQLQANELSQEDQQAAQHLAAWLTSDAATLTAILEPLASFLVNFGTLLAMQSRPWRSDRFWDAFWHRFECLLVLFSFILAPFLLRFGILFGEAKRNNDKRKETKRNKKQRGEEKRNEKKQTYNEITQKNMRNNEQKQK